MNIPDFALHTLYREMKNFPFLKFPQKKKKKKKSAYLRNFFKNYNYF